MTERVNLVASSPIVRHPIAPPLTGAGRRRRTLRLVDALYVELANQLDLLIVTTDRELASANKVHIARARLMVSELAAQARVKTGLVVD